MSVQDFLNQTVTIYRLQSTAGSKKQATKMGTAKTMIQPMSASAAQTFNITFARAYTAFVMPNANVLIGDYLQDNNGIKYDVQGARNYNFGSIPFIELLLQRQAQQGQI